MDDQLHDNPTPPMANPSLDMDDEDNQVSAAMVDGGEGANNQNGLTEGALDALNTSNPFDLPMRPVDAASNASSSELSELDENKFAGIDESALNFQRPPRELDEEALHTIKVTKRKQSDRAERADGREKERRKKGLQRKKERRRRHSQDEEVDMLGGNEQLDRGSRRKKPGTERAERLQESAQEKQARRRKEQEEADALLTPEERRQREREAYIDNALRGARKPARRRMPGVDSEDTNNQIIDDLRQNMISASIADAKLHSQGLLAANKIRYLDEVKRAFNNSTFRPIILDPEINFLEAVKFFIEPLSSSTLPGYTIQNTIWSLLEKFPMSVDALLASGLGNLGVFYTRSIQPDRAIKLKAARCVEEWARVILGRTDDATREDDGEIEMRIYDPERESRRAARREKQRANPLDQAGGRYGKQENAMQSVREAMRPNRAVIPEREFKTYSVAPVSTAQGREKVKRLDGDRGVLGRMSKR